MPPPRYRRPWGQERYRWTVNFESYVTPMTFLDIETSMRDPPMKILTEKGILFLEDTTALDFSAEYDCFF